MRFNYIELFDKITTTGNYNTNYSTYYYNINDWFQMQTFKNRPFLRDLLLRDETPFFAKCTLYLTYPFLLLLKLKMSNMYCSFVWKYKRSLENLKMLLTIRISWKTQLRKIFKKIANFISEFMDRAQLTKLYFYFKQINKLELVITQS